MKRKPYFTALLTLLALFGGSIGFLMLRDIPAPAQAVHKDLDPAVLAK